MLVSEILEAVFQTGDRCCVDAKVSYESRTSFMSVAIIDLSNKLPLAEKKAWNCYETESAIKTRSCSSVFRGQ